MVGSVWIEKRTQRDFDMKKRDAIKRERMKRRIDAFIAQRDLGKPTDPQIYLLIMNDLPPAATYGEAKAYISLLESDEDV